MPFKKVVLSALLMMTAVQASAQTDQAYDTANCQASFLNSCAPTTDTTTSSAFTSGGSAVPIGPLGNSPMETAFLVVLGLGILQTARRGIKKRKR